MTIPPVPGTPYHRLGHNAAHRWWRPVLGGFVVVSFFVLATVVVVLWLFVIGALLDRPEDADGFPVLGSIPDLGFELISVAVMLPCVLLAARWVQRRPAGTVSSVVGRLRWRWLFGCAGVAVGTLLLLWAGSSALLAATGGEGDTTGADVWVGGGTFAAGLAMLVVLVPVQAAAEEYFCRGWLLQAVGAFVRAPWLPIAVQALVFAGLHGFGTPWGFADLIVFGLVAGWLTVRTGGLEAAIALHVVNNLVGLGIAAAFVGALDTDETATDAGWQVAVVDIVLIVGYGLLIRRLARRFEVETVVPAALPSGYVGGTSSIGDGHMRTGTLAVPGADLYQEVRGAGPVLLFIHGGAGDAGMFGPLADLLADSYTVVTYDRRGNSRSRLTGPPTEQRIAEHADDASLLLRSIGPAPAIVVGSSAGAAIGVDLLLRHPEQVGLLIAHEPVILDLLPDADRWHALIQEGYETFQRDGVAPAMRLVSEAFGVAGPPEVLPADLPEPVRAMVARVQGNVPFSLAYEQRSFFRYHPDLDALRGAPLVLLGGADGRDALPYRTTALLAERLGTRVVDVPGDHIGYGTRPAEFAAALRAVLGSSALTPH